MENNFKFYNTLTKKIETVIPHEDGKIAMYTCGPFTLPDERALSEMSAAFDRDSVPPAI